MEFLSIAFFGLYLTFCFLYTFIMLRYIAGWVKIKTLNHNSSDFITSVTVIVPARNEQENIALCLNDIAKQNYPADLFEIIVVDDNSTDLTVSEIEKFQDDHKKINAHLIKLKKDPEVIANKKMAISEAIKSSKGKLIVTTDADCRMGDKWLSGIVTLYESQNPKMIAGPVCFHNEKTILQKIQTLEFAGLVSISGAGIALEKPIMCNDFFMVILKFFYF